jgi:hypothetical protein
MGDIDRLRRPGGRVVLRLPDASVADRLSARQVCAVRYEAGSRQRCCHPGAERTHRP